MSTRSLALRNTLFSSLGIYTEYFLGMLASIIIARHLGPADLGPYSLVIWVSGLGVALVNSGTNTAAIKFLAELRGSGREELITPVLAYLRGAERYLLLLVVALCAVAFWFGSERLVPPHVGYWLVIAVLAVSIALRAPYKFNIAVTKGFEDFRSTAAVALIGAPINIGLVLLAWSLDADVTGYLLVFAVSSVVFFLASRLQVRRLHQPGRMLALPPELLRRIRHHWRVTAVTVGVSYFAASEVELLFLNLYQMPAAAGHFKVAYQLAVGAALLVPGVFSALLLPMMANAVSKGGDVAGHRFAMATSYLLLLAAPLVAFGVPYSGAIIELLFGAEFAPAAPVFAICLCVSALSAVSAGGSSLLISADRQLTLLILLICLAVLKVTLDASLIHVFGLGGAVTAYAVAAVTGTLTVIALALRHSGASLQWGRIARILLAAALAAGIAWPLRGLLSPFPGIVLGGAVVAAAYLVLIVLLGGLEADDYQHVRGILQRLSGGRLRIVAGWLARLEARARRHA